MATKNYMINDKWLDLDKQNIVELQSVDGVLDSMKVNGSEIVTPSGKITITENGTDIDIAQYALADVNVESDLSTATVTIVIEETTTAESCEFYYAEIMDNEEFSGIIPGISFYSGDILMPLYKGVCEMYIRGNVPNTISVTGNVTYEAYPDDNEGIFTITGNCTVTVS